SGARAGSAGGEETSRAWAKATSTSAGPARRLSAHTSQRLPWSSTRSVAMLLPSPAGPASEARENRQNGRSKARTAQCNGLRMAAGHSALDDVHRQPAAAGFLVLVLHVVARSEERRVGEE